MMAQKKAAAKKTGGVESSTTKEGAKKPAAKATAAPAPKTKALTDVKVTAFGFYPIKQHTQKTLNITAAPLPNGQVILHAGNHFEVVSGVQIMKHPEQEIYKLVGDN
jgi:hypothetical protein